MPADRYFGKYARFDTASKREASAMLGSDNLVGDVFNIVFEAEDGKSVAWIKNRFDTKIGYLDDKQTHELQLLAARGWKLHALLAFFAYTDEPEPGFYWGQVALMCYEPQYEHAFDNFLQGVSKKLGSGTRLNIALGTKGINRVIESDGAWLPKDKVRLPSMDKSSVIMKSHRTWNERLIEQGRRGNRGCIVISWIVLLAIVALIIVALRACGVF